MASAVGVAMRTAALTGGRLATLRITPGRPSTIPVTTLSTVESSANSACGSDGYWVVREIKHHSNPHNIPNAADER